MFPVDYDATFEDVRGAERTVIRNDGATLALTLRGVALRGSDFDALAPAPEDAARAAECLTLSGCGDLCACRLAWTMPLAAEVAGAPVDAQLRAVLDLGTATPNGGIDAERLALTLALPSRTAASSGRSGWFEDELRELVAQLAPDEAIRSCFTCLLSDYSPAGHGLFGALACFRDAADAYLAVRTKEALFALWERRSGYVQETHVCPAFRPRPAGTGYRG